MGLAQFSSLGAIKTFIHPSIYLSNCNTALFRGPEMLAFLKVSVFEEYVTLRKSTTVTGSQGFIANECLDRQSTTDTNLMEGGEMRENISCVSGEQGEKLQFTVCNGSTPLSYWSPSSSSRQQRHFGGTLSLLRDGRVKGQPSPNKWLKCVRTRRGR